MEEGQLPVCQSDQYLRVLHAGPLVFARAAFRGLAVAGTSTRGAPRDIYSFVSARFVCDGEAPMVAAFLPKP